MSNLDEQTQRDLDFIDTYVCHVSGSLMYLTAKNLAKKVRELDAELTRLQELPPKLLVTINVEGLIKFLLGWEPVGDDSASVIGDSRVAYLSEKDPAHVFMPAAEWHDAAYVKGSPEQLMGMTRWNVDLVFLIRCLHIARDNYALKCEAVTLFLLVCKFAAGYYEGLQNLQP